GLYQAIHADDTSVVALRGVVARFLQTPQFLYRVELSGQDVDNAPAKLTCWEVASRLSYFLWRSMPDEALFRAAEQDELKTPDQVAAQAERMLNDPRAREMVQSFHEEWLNLAGLDQAVKNAQMYPDFTELRPLFKTETETFIDRVVWDGA